MVVSNDMPQTRLPDSAVAWKNDKFPKGVKDVGVLTIQVNAQSANTDCYAQVSIAEGELVGEHTKTNF